MVPGTGTWTTEFLGLASPVVGNEEGTVVLGQGLLELVLCVLIDVLLVVGNKGLGNGLTDGINLGGVTTTVDTDTDVDVGELVKTNDEERLVDLKSEDLWLNEGKRRSVDLDETTAGLAVGDGSGRLLLAEALNTLGWGRHDCGCNGRRSALGEVGRWGAGSSVVDSI